MTGNLFVQEYVDTRKGLGAILAVYVVAQVVLWAAIAAGIPFLTGFLTALSGLLMVALPIGALSYLAWNYWQSMYGKRGYFTFSIPVRGRVLYAVKVGYAALVTTGSWVLTAVSIPALITASAVGLREPVSQAFAFVMDQIPPQVPGWIFVGIACLILLQSYGLIIAGAAIMSIGAQGKYNSLGFGAPVIGAIIYYVSVQVINVITILIVPLGIGLAGPEAGKLVPRGMAGELLGTLETGAEPSVLGLGSFIAAIFIAAGMWVWAVNAIEKHTSLR